MSLHALHLLATLYMCGVIWMVQLVQYPLIDLYAGQHQEYTRRMGWVVGPAMLLELFAQVLALWRSPSALNWIGSLLLAILWTSTFFLQVPLHQQLSLKYDPGIHQRLIRSNWIRTAAWSARALLLLSSV